MNQYDEMILARLQELDAKAKEFDGENKKVRDAEQTRINGQEFEPKNPDTKSRPKPAHEQNKKPSHYEDNQKVKEQLYEIFGINAEVVKKNGRYYIKFDYRTPEDAEKVRGIVEELLLGYGSNSPRANDPRGYIQPRMVDPRTGETLDHETEDGMIRDMYVPDDLVEAVTRRLVEVDDAAVTIGHRHLVRHFDRDVYNFGKQEIDEMDNDKHL